MRAYIPTIPTLLLHCLIFLQMVPHQSSAFQLTTTLTKFKEVAFFITPTQQTLGATLNIEVYYTQKNTDGTTTLVRIYSSSVVQAEQILKYTICNFQNSDQLITIGIASTSQSNLTSSIATIGEMRTRSLYTTALDKDTSGGYMLPFNMFNQKILQLYVIAYNASLQLGTYKLEPFMSTYWTQIQSNIELLPHLPYFSQCSLQKSFILISDLIKPLACTMDDFFGVLCKEKRVDFTCIIEELEVSNVGAQFWFNKDKEILYFLFENEVPLENLYQMSQNLISVQKLILHQYDNLVPVIYHRLSTDQIIVNEFHIDIQVALNGNSGMSIVSAGIKGNYNKGVESPKAVVHTHVSYLNFYQRFNSYALGIQWYIGYAIFINIIFIFFIWLVTSKFCVIDVKQKMDHILTPAVKGAFYTLITGGFFFIIINEIAYQSDFNGISPLYGDTLTNQLLQLNNIGRNGLAVVFIGFYLLIVSLKQAFSVSKNEDLKIVFEDHLKFESKQALTEDEMEEKVKFTKKNMISHKKFLLITSMLIIFLGFCYISIAFSFCSFQLALITIFVIPITSKILAQQLKYLIIKQLLYLAGHLLSLILICSIITFKSRGVLQFTYLYLSRYMNLYVQVYLIEIFFQWIVRKIDNCSEDNRVYKLLSKILKTVIQFKRNQSEYERALYLSSLIIIEILGVLLLPIIYLTFYLVQRNRIFIFGLLIDETPMVTSMVMSLLLIPMQIYSIFAIIEILKKETGFRIEEVIKFNRFKFKRRKFRWMNDEFPQSKNIHFFYREYQKFAFSSQLYFVISLLGYSAFLIYIGLLVVLQSSYLFMSDPASLIILTIVIIVGDVLSVFASFVALKLKLYDQQSEEIVKQSLIKTQKYLKNNDLVEYLQEDEVKKHFLDYKKQWIIENLHLIFQKQDFEQNNGQLITKYKYYKSLSKKREIQAKQQIKKQKENSIINNNPQIPTENKVIFNKKEFNLLIKPIMYYWFYLSKQNIFLKNIINCVKKQKIKKNCEFCNMDIQLQALERKDFQTLVNQFRLLNVKKSFDAQSFLEFYRLNQKYVTICIQCKQKNLHLENKITLKQISSKLMKRWLLVAKSNLLHKNANK